MSKLAVIAIGGNSLIKDAAHQEVEDQYAAISETAARIADVVQTGHRILVTHGNGPQVGFILRRSEIAHQQAGLHFVPLVSCVADTQGAIGYQIQQALSNSFKEKGIQRQVLSVVTQMKVDADDAAFNSPSKPIGGYYSQAQKELICRDHPHWHFTHEKKSGYRRIVPSPRPREIVELDAIAVLLENHFCVVACGGGGIPVVANPDGSLTGVDAVIDKDFASAMLATRLKADTLVISTDVEAVCLNFGTPRQKPLGHLTAAQAKHYIDEGHFAAGSMLPKIQAALEFLTQGGAKAVITSPENMVEALAGRKGTTMTNQGGKSG